MRLILCSTLLCGLLPLSPSTGAALNDFYLHYQASQFGDPVAGSNSTPTRFVPVVNLRRGELSPAPVASIDRFMLLDAERGLSFKYQVRLFGPRQATAVRAPCKIEPTLIPNPLSAGAVVLETNQWRDPNQAPEGCGPNFFLGPSPVRWVLPDRMTFTAPVRRTALDGSEYEASAMRIERAGVPWITYYWGYRLGLVSSESNWSALSLIRLPAALQGWPTFPNPDEEFELAALPPPFVEGEVTEFINTEDFPNSPGGQFSYAVTDEEKRKFDDGGAGKWQRTGKRFKTGGYVSVCRFYGSVTPGPDSYFYTAVQSECDALKAAQVTPKPANRQQLNFEGAPFRASLPFPKTSPDVLGNCPAATIRLYRAYNGAYGANGKRNFDSNHRYSTELNVIRAMANLGWVNEGVVMCVPE